VRSPSRASHLENAGIQIIPGDLNQPTAIAQLCDSVDLVIHCAGAVRGNCYDDFSAVNVDGTRELLGAVTRQPSPPRVFLLSSMAAREPGLSWYSRSKREAEQLLEAEQALEWTILRPPAVYGPGDKEMKAVFDTMAQGFALVPGSPDARNSLLHVDDLVEALLALMSSERHHSTYTVCDGREGGYSWREMASIAGSVWGRRVRVVRVPRLLLDAVANCNLFLARLSGRAAMLTPPKLRELRHPDWVVDNRQITADTGWKPRRPLESGLEKLAN
jgi:nucleoside-diphosphate-sugar epimerase